MISEEDFIIEHEGRIQARSPKQRFDGWVSTYSYKRNKVVEFYSSDEIKKIENRVASAPGFQSAPSGANIVLLKPFDKSAFFDSRVCEELMIVSAIQAILDLKSCKGRGEEAADVLMTQVLEKRWVQHQNTVLAK